MTSEIAMTHPPCWLRLAAILFATALFAQTPPAPGDVSPPSFEVASVKATDPHAHCLSNYHNQPGLVGPGGRVTLQCTPLVLLIKRAFDGTEQIDFPGWAFMEVYDVSAIAPVGALPGQYTLMFRNLLIDRFGLRYHTEAPLTTAYVLTAAPGGPTIETGLDDPEPAKYGVISTASSRGETRARAPVLGVYRFWDTNDARRVDFDNITMKGLAGYAKSFLDLPVVDLTGLSGTYRASVEVPRRQCRAGRPAGEENQDLSMASDPCADGLRLLTASLRKQGLLLERRKVPYEKVVIDRLDKTPAAN